MQLQLEIDYCQLIPFRYKFHILKLTNISEVKEKTETLHALPYEKYSDAMRFLDIESGKVVIIPDFIIPSFFKPSKANKPTKTLPSEVNALNHQYVHLHSPQPAQSIKSTPCATIEAANQGNPEPTTAAQGPSMKG
ncbi:hypothetical protein O181_006152 [Austropuccinia psidii MF-1]|uniref:Uncharacterized protein n=1 Tax=Austropuccinia psidii MF-1 TaxID=1389203 RepID=A0A9Q3GHC2_9BASI|nr:hypothetical protein [Austropuccinia psidii MF-1]